MAHDSPDADFPCVILGLHACIHDAIEALRKGDVARAMTIRKAAADLADETLPAIDSLKAG